MKSMWALGLAGLSLAACSEEETPQLEDAVPLADGELRAGAPILADVTLGSGNHLIFLELEGGVALYERTPPDAPGLESHEILRGASVAEVFLAATEADTPIPEALLRRSQVSRELGPRGWLRDPAVAVTPPPASHACDNSAFASAVAAFGYDDRGTPDLRLNQLVAVQAPFFVGHSECMGTSWNGPCPYFYRYEVGGNNGSIWYDVDRYYTRVAICGMGAHPTITSNYGNTWTHPGPVVQVWYRTTDSTTWKSALHEDLTAADVGSVRAWHYNGSGGPDWDWRTTITLAKPYDSFDIGHALEDL
jgi:hypothetical protein